MSILEQIKSDQLAARKARDNVKSAVLGLVSSEIIKVAGVYKDEGIVASDEDAIRILKKFVANNDECIAATRSETAKENFKLENSILSVYLPQQFDKTVLKRLITQLDLADQPVGVIMKTFKEKFPGQYDGKLLSEVAKNFTA